MYWELDDGFSRLFYAYIGTHTKLNVYVRIIEVWQIGPNVSSMTRWCLALTSARQQWCLLWRFNWYVCCACVNGGPGFAWVGEVWLPVLLLFVLTKYLEPWNWSTSVCVAIWRSKDTYLSFIRHILMFCSWPGETWTLTDSHSAFIV